MPDIVGWIFAAVFACYGAVLSVIVIPTRAKVEEMYREFFEHQTRITAATTANRELIGGLNGTVNRHELTIGKVVDLQVACARMEVSMNDICKKLDKLNGRV